MKFLKQNKWFVLVAIAALFSACNTTQKTEQAVEPVDYTSYVDPYIGSGEHGHVFVGASVPFGMVQIGPQNIHKGWDWCSGYHYSDSVIIGFSHTHLSGTGCSDLGDILVMPYPGETTTLRGEQDNIEGAASSYYKHSNEKVAPGYYSLLMDNGINVELTATNRVALHSYTYPSDKPSNLLINLLEGNGDRVVESYIKQVDDHTIEGYRFSKGWSPTQKVFFVMKTNQPMKSFTVYDDDTLKEGTELKAKGVKGNIVFVDHTEKAQVKVAISSVSIANANANMEAELRGWDFNKVRTDAVALWNKQLDRIDVKTTSDRAKKIFYTAMYHMSIAPTTYCDVNGEFRGHDDKIYKAQGTNYSTFSLWDTYRTLNPLFTIIHPEMVDDFVNSMLSMYDQQSYLPIWPLVGGETNCMPGYSAVAVITDAYLKGFKGFDAERAFSAIKASTTYKFPQGIDYVVKQGYIPCDKVGEATSKAMEYAVSDYGVALMAKKMNKQADYENYLKRGKYYHYYFDQSTNFVRPKLSNGKFVDPYDPFKSVHGGLGWFTEGNGWHYTFFAPQDPAGLIKLFGGDKNYTDKLDELFTANGDMGEEASADISGLIGMYAHGNEPSHHVLYMYPYGGQQWKTAEKVRLVQRDFYTDQPEGIIGNEDCGQMSAWHVMSALGFYQVGPSGGVLVFGSPLFDEATIQLPNDKKFTVSAENNSDTNIYIQSVELNGQPYTKAYITYQDVMNGGTLKFVMGATPNKQFGSDPADRPFAEQ